MADCEHCKNGLCLISTELAGQGVAAAEDACQACVASKSPKSVNRVTISKAIYTLHLHGKSVPHDLRVKLSASSQARQRYPHGPGTELAKLVSWFKLTNKKCDCASRITKMNRWGPDECEKRLPTIKRWLRHSAKTHSVPYVDAVVTALIQKAIRNARKRMDSGDYDGTA